MGLSRLARFRILLPCCCCRLRNLASIEIKPRATRGDSPNAKQIEVDGRHHGDPRCYLSLPLRPIKPGSGRRLDGHARSHPTPICTGRHLCIAISAPSASIDRSLWSVGRGQHPETMISVQLEGWPINRSIAITGSFTEVQAAQRLTARLRDPAHLTLPCTSAVRYFNLLRELHFFPRPIAPFDFF